MKFDKDKLLNLLVSVAGPSLNKTNPCFNLVSPENVEGLHGSGCMAAGLDV